LQEALEKIDLGMKIMLRESSAARDFETLSPWVGLHPESVMFCTDDSHPDDFIRFYIDNLVRRSLKKGYSIQNIIQVCTKNPIDHYQLDVGFLQEGDPADFIMVDNLEDFTILKTFINGEEVFDGTDVTVPALTVVPINNFYSNQVSLSDLQVKAQKGKKLHVIEIIKDSLLTKHLTLEVTTDKEFLASDVNNDLLKLVVLNRYRQAKPSIGFVKGLGLKQGAIGTSVAHDSHNIIIAGTDDESILQSIRLIQRHKGGLACVNSSGEYILPLPIAGLMSDQSYQVVAKEYEKINQWVGATNLRTPFMTLSFLSLLVIPELKLGDRGLFDVNQFQFIDLQL
jgi:adenine deaminase